MYMPPFDWGTFCRGLRKGQRIKPRTRAQQAALEKWLRTTRRSPAQQQADAEAAGYATINAYWRALVSAMTVRYYTRPARSRRASRRACRRSPRS